MTPLYTFFTAAADSQRTLAASYIRRHPIKARLKAELKSWAETITEAILFIVCIVAWFVLAVLATHL